MKAVKEDKYEIKVIAARFNKLPEKASRDESNEFD
jgi:hypothetical protein